MATAESGISAANAIPKNNYAPKSFESNQNKYAVEGYSYPENLMGHMAEYGSNYVLFYINVNEASKMLENPAAGLTVDIDTNERIKKGITGKEYSTASVLAVQTAIGATQGTAAGGVLAGALADKLGKGAIVGGLIGAAVQGGGAAAIAANASGFSRAQKRLKTAIALHVPNQLSIRYGANWSDEETFGMQAAQTGIEIAKALATSSGSIADNAKTAAKGISSIAASVALTKGPNAGAISAMSGLAANPMKEQIFKGIDFRTFNVDYSFSPRNAAESRGVLNIIAAFKYHMHPEYKDANNFLFLYPSEFDIVYYHNGAENMNIHRHTSCVLTEMQVNYTPNGNFTTFAGGMPTQINITMTFKELTILTKELIAQGL